MIFRREKVLKSNHENKKLDLKKHPDRNLEEWAQSWSWFFIKGLPWAWSKFDWKIKGTLKIWKAIDRKSSAKTEIWVDLKSAPDQEKRHQYLKKYDLYL